MTFTTLPLVGTPYSYGTSIPASDTFVTLLSILISTLCLSLSLSISLLVKYCRVSHCDGLESSSPQTPFRLDELQTLPMYLRYSFLSNIVFQLFCVMFASIQCSPLVLVIVMSAIKCPSVRITMLRPNATLLTHCVKA